jgi:hypothetical protein
VRHFAVAFRSPRGSFREAPHTYVPTFRACVRPSKTPRRLLLLHFRHFTRRAFVCKGASRARERERVTFSRVIERGPLFYTSLKCLIRLFALSAPSYIRPPFFLLPLSRYSFFSFFLLFLFLLFFFPPASFQRARHFYQGLIIYEARRITPRSAPAPRAARALFSNCCAHCAQM